MIFLLEYVFIFLTHCYIQKDQIMKILELEK